MPLPIHYTSRHTGWQLAYGLRTDRFPDGYEFQSTLGCLDAPTSMASGSVVGVTDYKHMRVRVVSERAVLRPGS